MEENQRNSLKADQIKTAALALGADIVGIAPAGPVANKEKFLDWLSRGYAADMDYLAKYQEERFDPEKLLPGAKAVISVGLNYYQDDKSPLKEPRKYKVARYAWGEDYHHVIRKLLEKLRSGLIAETPGLKGRICVDTAPFMDKYWAREAGLGWQGKHTNLVSKQFGSWLLLGSLVINAEVDNYDTPHRDLCGECNSCISACPTGAIVEPYVLDANKCISYWTIESRAESIPEDIARKLDGMIFGCDICIRVCPFNRRQIPTRTEAFFRKDELVQIENGQVIEYPDEVFENGFRHSAFTRAGLKGLKRNIATASKYYR